MLKNLLMSPSIRRIAVSIALVVLVSCSKPAQPQPQQQGRGGRGGGGRQGAGAQVISVAVARAETRDLPVYLTGLGSVGAFNTVVIKSRLDGQLVNVAFKE